MFWHLCSLSYGVELFSTNTLFTIAVLDNPRFNNLQFLNMKNINECGKT